ncbi:bacillithiol system redox-active protein YtxJ [Pedobacter xixiisoli]|uniref:Bacillithiol system protein YtxJ n=1 Tax=Pedobacter xixiisoli TaxID=1476464 RepID=A0A286A891_9SPHI|nr:bacillithiol system redox-active protein YtxJ [Pedobacter xixiisoli]SOD18130.1 bacillithiol system protein YtxJ [Pedobacter xixiisoli]
MNNWIDLNQIQQIEEIKAAEGYTVIFKHSTRCSISLMAKRTFERDWDAIPTNVSFYFLDLINHRDISAHIAETFQVHHESPQLLLIKNGDCILDASHSDISADEVAEVMSK